MRVPRNIFMDQQDEEDEKKLVISSLPSTPPPSPAPGLRCGQRLPELNLPLDAVMHDWAPARQRAEELLQQQNWYQVLPHGLNMNTPPAPHEPMVEVGGHYAGGSADPWYHHHGMPSTLSEFGSFHLPTIHGGFGPLGPGAAAATTGGHGGLLLPPPHGHMDAQFDAALGTAFFHTISPRHLDLEKPSSFLNFGPEPPLQVWHANTEAVPAGQRSSRQRLPDSAPRTTGTIKTEIGMMPRTSGARGRKRGRRASVSKARERRGGSGSGTLANAWKRGLEDRAVRDDFLVQSKRLGMTYREIRARGGFTEAESTLRGRFRTLTKSKEARVRKPEWKERDIALLQRGVIIYTKGDITSSKTKIPWKLVGQFIKDNGGSYHFGNATCRKKFDELIRRK